MEQIGIIIFFVLFIVLWIIVVFMLRSISGMNKKIDIEKGDYMGESPWGSGGINGTSASGCLKVIKYQNGWLFRIMLVFGGGKLWIPGDNITISEFDEVGFLFKQKRLHLTSGNNDVWLFGKLALFVYLEENKGKYI